jgi:6-pyruvoyltetrahydropterin/6-carboxytetrahydropterin synthase
MSGGFEVGAATPLRALHRMPGMPGPEGDLHAHDYRVEVTVERATLDGRGMVCDLDVLTAALGDVLGQLEGKDLERIRPPEVEAVTVEVLARWLHGALADAVAAVGGETLAVRVWESPDAYGGYRGRVA